MMKTRFPLVVLATGGTGGHVFPAQALAEEMLDRRWRVQMFIDQRGLRFTGGVPELVDIRMISSATFSRGGFPAKLLTPLKIVQGILSAVIKMILDRPLVVVGFGGYTSFPPVAAALAVRVPCLIHEQNGNLGKANRILSRFVRLVACGTKLVSDVHSGKSVETGNPVRADVLNFSEVAYQPPAAGRMNILIVGGSQGADLFDQIIPAAVAALPSPLREEIDLMQQVRADRIDEVKRVYVREGIRHEVKSFFDNIPQRLAKSQLIVARAGASTVAELKVVGRPAILIPFAAATNDHQSFNARQMEIAGAAISIAEKELSAERLAAELKGILLDPERARVMAEASRSDGRPQAASRLADLVVELSKGKLRQ